MGDVPYIIKEISGKIRQIRSGKSAYPNTIPTGPLKLSMETTEVMPYVLVTLTCEDS